MKQTDQDKAAEFARYNLRAEAVLTAGRVAQLGPEGAAGVTETLRTPYLVYETIIRRHARPGTAVLDLCCGNGQHSLTAAREGAAVTVTDIAPNNVELTRERGSRAGFVFAGQCADAEKLPFPTASFDVVTCAGSLSYLDLDQFLGEVTRVLRHGGGFIVVDSLNHNPVYRLNRWLHFLSGERSLSTLKRMPTLTTIRRIRATFPDLQVSFHGVFSFLAPVLSALVGPKKTADLLDAADRRMPFLRRFAFKFVGVGHKPVQG